VASGFHNGTETKKVMKIYSVIETLALFR